MDLIEISALSTAQIHHLLALAERCLSDDHHVITPPEWRGILDHRIIAMTFFEPSTRTRVSFELAAKRLGARTALVTPEGSSAVKGERIMDTCENVAAMGIDALVLRHSAERTPHEVAERLGPPVLNAGNGKGAHPTQGLLDALVLRRALGGLEGRTIAILGDVAHSRVAASDQAILSRLGARVIIAGPPALLPADDEPRWVGVERCASRDEALEQADAVIMLRIQRERLTSSDDGMDQADYVARWGVDEACAARVMRPGAPILHPGPVMVGVELSEAMTRHPRSLILRQVAYGVAVRQAALVWALGLDTP